MILLVFTLLFLNTLNSIALFGLNKTTIRKVKKKQEAQNHCEDFFLNFRMFSVTNKIFEMLKQFQQSEESKKSKFSAVTKLLTSIAEQQT